MLFNILLAMLAFALTALADGYVSICHVPSHSISLSISPHVVIYIEYPVISSPLILLYFTSPRSYLLPFILPYLSLWR